MTRIFTGLQPTNTLHIGNYLGSILPWHALVEKSGQETEAYLMIADQHAITVKGDPEKLKQKIYEVAAIMLASGVDHKKHVIFPQSQNPDHAYLGWLFTANTPLGWLDRMTQFKEKKQKMESYKEAVSAGLYTYPALMAADILLYDTDIVPVGVDQKQHVEFTCDIANRFNSLFGETFKVPAFSTNKETTKLYDLQDPSKKMSKSDADDAGRISLTDSVDDIRKKIMKSKTDSENIVSYDQMNKPGITNLLAIFAAVTGKKTTELAETYKEQGYGVFKSTVADAVIAYLEPFQSKMNGFLKDKGQLRMILDDGAARSYEISHPKLVEAATKLGIYLHA
jgi:tryptophanyl-tRNA synthetase